LKTLEEMLEEISEGVPEEVSEEILDEISEEMLEEKACTKCGITQPLASGFYDDKRASNGKNSWCKKCCEANTKENERRRISEPLSPQAEDMRKLFAARFQIIKEAGLSMDVGGLKNSNRIDRVLKDHGLYGDISRIPARGKPVVLGNRKFKGGNKPCKQN